MGRRDCNFNQEQDSSAIRALCTHGAQAPWNLARLRQRKKWARNGPDSGRALAMMMFTCAVGSGRPDAPVVELRPQDLVQDLLLPLSKVDVLLPHRLRLGRRLVIGGALALAQPAQNDEEKR